MKEENFQLKTIDNKLSLILPEQAKPICVDFLSNASKYRRKRSGRRQLIAKAVGLKPHYNPTILDCTAGFGKDGFVLACLNCEVTLLERSPIIAKLLEDGLNRAKQDPSCASLELTLIETNAIYYLQRLKTHKLPDVIYLDPMFPERKKSALNKKTIRDLKAIVGADLDAKKLLAIALKKAKKRVVVKRPRLAPAIEGPQPSLTYQGKSTRFDVYIAAI